MKALVVFLISCMVYASAQNGKLLKQEFDINPDGSYSHLYELDDGIKFQESGVGGQYAEGSYRYVSPEGEKIAILYRADENGYHPEGSVLPTPHPIPEYILRALDYIKKNSQ